MRNLIACSSWICLWVAVVGCSQDLPKREEMSYVAATNATNAGEAAAEATWPESVLIENDEHQFSIRLPEDWGKISKKLLSAQSDAVSAPGNRIDYIAGYQIAGKWWLDHPMILVRRLPESALPKSKISIARREVQDSQESVRDEIRKTTNSAHVTDFDVGVPALEESTGIVWMKFKLDAKDGRHVEGLIANYYHGDFVYQFAAATRKEDGARDWPSMERCLRSVKFDQ